MSQSNVLNSLDKNANQTDLTINHNIIQTIKTNKNNKRSKDELSASSNNYLFFFHLNNFVSELFEYFDTKYHSIFLYHQLLSRTGLCHTTVINKHMTAAENAILRNIHCLTDQSTDKADDFVFRYSDKVFIDVTTILNDANNDDDRQIFWQYIYSIALQLPSISTNDEFLVDKDLFTCKLERLQMQQKQSQRKQNYISNSSVDDDGSSDLNGESDSNERMIDSSDANGDESHQMVPYTENMRVYGSGEFVGSRSGSSGGSGGSGGDTSGFNPSTSSREENLIEDMFSKIESKIGNLEEDEYKNPTDVIQKMLSTGIVTDLLTDITGEMKRGPMKMENMFEAMQNVFTRHQPKANNADEEMRQEQMPNPLNMLGTMQNMMPMLNMMMSSMKG